MASEVQICNLALSHIGVRAIQSLTEASKEARQCKTLYEPSRNAVLEDHDWGFARKRLTLAELTETYTDWTYAYQYPTDCICARRILDETGGLTGTSYDIDNDRYVEVGKVPFEVAANAALDGRIILTEKESAELVYTARVTDPNMFSSLFIAALSWRLASDLAQPLRANAQLKQLMLAEYIPVINKAKAINANEGHQMPDNVNTLMRARQ